MAWDCHQHHVVLEIRYYLLTLIHKLQKMKRLMKEDLIKARNRNDLFEIDLFNYVLLLKHID
jgi:hypothetical protein